MVLCGKEGWGGSGERGLRHGEGNGESGVIDPVDRSLGLKFWRNDTGDAGFVEGVLSEDLRDVDGVDLGV